MVNSINNVLGAGVAATNPYPTFNDFRTAVSDRKVNGAFRSGWQPDYPSAENYLVQNFASAAADGNGSNDGDYKNPEFDALCDKAAASKSVADANSCTSRHRKCCSTTCRPFRCTTPMPMVWPRPVSPASR